MQKTSPPFSSLRSWLPLAATALAIGLASQASAQFLTPGFRGGANTEYSAWDVFSAPNNGVANYPDIAAPNGVKQTRSAAGFPTNSEYNPADPIAFWDAANATVAQTGGGAFIIGAGTAGNIYSFSEATEFRLDDTTPFSLQTIVLQFRTSGTELDYANIRLDIAGTLYAPDFAQELSRTSSGGGFGGTNVEYAVQWDLRPLGSTSSYAVRFASSGSSMSFGALSLDTSDSFSQVVAVPEPSTYALLAVGLLTAIMLRRRRAC